MTFCYEYADDVYQLGLKNLFAKDTASGDTSSDGRPSN